MRRPELRTHHAQKLNDATAPKKIIKLTQLTLRRTTIIPLTLTSQHPCRRCKNPLSPEQCKPPVGNAEKSLFVTVHLTPFSSFLHPHTSVPCCSVCSSSQEYSAAYAEWPDVDPHRSGRIGSLGKSERNDELRRSRFGEESEGPWGVMLSPSLRFGLIFLYKKTRPAAQTWQAELCGEIVAL